MLVANITNIIIRKNKRLVLWSIIPIIYFLKSMLSNFNLEIISNSITELKLWAIIPAIVFIIALIIEIRKDKRKKNIAIFNQLKRNTENYFRTVTNTKSFHNMYTVFKPYCKYIKGEGYAKGFVPCNARGTNEFREKKSLAYLVNFFMQPDIKQFIDHYHIDFDEDLFSLS